MAGKAVLEPKFNCRGTNNAMHSTIVVDRSHYRISAAGFLVTLGDNAQCWSTYPDTPNRPCATGIVTITETTLTATLTILSSSATGAESAAE